MPSDNLENQPLLSPEIIDAEIVKSNQIEAANPEQIMNLEAGRAEHSSLELAVSSTKQLLVGMSQTYATFYILANQRPGFWLAAPVFTGGFIRGSEPIFKHLEKKFPHHKSIKTLTTCLKYINQIVINFFEDYGFTYSTLNMVAAQFCSMEFLQNTLATIIAPLASIIPALIIRCARFNHELGGTNSTLLEVFATGFYAANSTTLTTGLLQIQSVIPENSWIPMAVMSFCGALGSAAGLIKKSHPRIALILTSIIEACVENPSLAVAFFAFSNDFYAAANHGKIPNAFFFSIVSTAVFYLLTLVWFSVGHAKEEWHKLDSRIGARDDVDIEEMVQDFELVQIDPLEIEDEDFPEIEELSLLLQNLTIELLPQQESEDIEHAYLPNSEDEDHNSADETDEIIYTKSPVGVNSTTTETLITPLLVIVAEQPLNEEQTATQIAAKQPSVNVNEQPINTARVQTPPSPLSFFVNTRQKPADPPTMISELSDNTPPESNHLSIAQG